MFRIIFFYFLILFSNATYSQCRYTDSLTLVELYNTTGGENWINEWDLTDPMDTWFGITLNTQGCVKCIDLDGRLDCGGYSFNNLGNNLIGYIPESLGTLSQLEHLSLGNNLLTGPIPVSLSQLQNLRELILRYNDLTGIIPPELGNLQKLELLNLTSNELVGDIPQEIGFMGSLSNLFIADNNLTGEIPSAFSNQSLIAFGASGNQLSGEIPAFLGEVILSRLYLQDNQFVGCFPQELETLCDRDVNFSNNIAMPWQGDFEKFCDGLNQINAPCEDGFPYTVNYIDTSCDCIGMFTSVTTDQNIPLKIYPNPVQDYFVISGNEAREFVFTLFSELGQELFTSEDDHQNTGHLSHGLYLLRAQNKHNGSSSWIKIIKQ